MTHSLLTPCASTYSAREKLVEAGLTMCKAHVPSASTVAMIHQHVDVDGGKIDEGNVQVYPYLGNPHEVAAARNVAAKLLSRACSFEGQARFGE
mgnify:FL=1